MRLALAIGLFCAGCGGAGGEWPSLARRPAERPAPKPALVTRPPPPAPLPTAASLRALDERLALAERDLRALLVRADRQARALEAAIGRARGRPGDDARGAIELELTRLESVSTDAASLIDRLRAPPPLTNPRARIIARDAEAARARLSATREAARDALAR